MKKINGEPVKLVESFEELKPGMIVWVVNCNGCSGRHRFILLSPERSVTSMSGGQVVRCFAFAPVMPCLPARDAVISEVSVGSKRVYRVIDEQLDADTTGERTTRELEHKRKETA